MDAAVDADVASAFETLLEQHGAEVRRFVQRLVRGSADSEDLCQEAFLRAYRGYGRIHGQPEAQPRAWLFRVAGNVCLDYLRRQARHRSVELVADVVSPGVLEDGVVARAEVDRLRALVQELPARQRRALTLRRVEGLDYPEVARLMGGTPEAARANVYQAVRQLKRAMEQADGPVEERR